MSPHPSRWHFLFDDLCTKAGLADPSALAARYCEVANGGSKKGVETALRNLNNWRSGRHIPRLRSLRILERMLGVEADPALLAEWNALYRQAREEDDEEVTPAPSREWSQASTQPSRFSWPIIAVGAILFTLGGATGLAAGSGWRPWAVAADAPLVPWKAVVTMRIGESRIVHGARGDCGRLPQEWDYVIPNLPATNLGVFTDGGLIRRPSKACKGPTPARGIRFTATAAGVEEMILEGDLTKVTVLTGDAPTLPSPNQ